jgi:hypothetical protein
MWHIWGIRKKYRYFVGNSKEKRPLGRQTPIGRMIRIKWILKIGMRL